MQQMGRENRGGMKQEVSSGFLDFLPFNAACTDEDPFDGAVKVDFDALKVREKTAQGFADYF